MVNDIIESVEFNEPEKLGVLSIDLSTDTDFQKPGKEVVVSYPVDWPDWDFYKYIRVDVYVFNDVTGDLYDNWSDEGKYWWDYTVEEGAREVIQMPDFPIRIKVEAWLYDAIKTDWIKDAVATTTVSTFTNGEEEPPEEEEEEEEPMEWYLKEYYGIPAWQWGVGGFGAIILLELLAGGKKEQPIVILGSEKR